MDAKKCDRCGVFYDVRYGVTDYAIKKHAGIAWPDVDLCQRCYGDFVVFMKNPDMVPIYYKNQEEEEFGVE